LFEGCPIIDDIANLATSSFVKFFNSPSGLVVSAIGFCWSLETCSVVDEEPPQLVKAAIIIERKIVLIDFILSVFINNKIDCQFTKNNP
jgi:hypothetical protein